MLYLEPMIFLIIASFFAAFPLVSKTSTYLGNERMFFLVFAVALKQTFYLFPLMDFNVLLKLRSSRSNFIYGSDVSRYSCKTIIAIITEFRSSSSTSDVVNKLNN